MSMIESIADTLPQWEFAPCPDENPDCPGGLACPRNATSAAYAVLQVMREPTDRMVQSVDEPANGYGEHIWRTMVDTALEEGA